MSDQKQNNEQHIPELPKLTEDKIEPEKTIYSYAELLNYSSELPMLFAPIFLAEGLAVLYGPTGCGKSNLLRLMCACVGAQRDFLKWTYQGKHHRAIYCSSEDGANITAWALRKMNKELNLPEEAAQRIRFLFENDAEMLPDRLREMLTQQLVDLIVVDAFDDAFIGRSTNDTLEVRRFLDIYAAIAKEFHCLIIFNAHASKFSANMPPSPAAALGSQAIISRPRLAIEMRPDRLNEDVKHLCIVKGTHLSSDHKKESHVLKMDKDTLTFIRTDDRVPFAELVSPRTKTEEQPKSPQSYTYSQHSSFLLGAFANGMLNNSELKKCIMEKFTIGDYKARDYVTYYLAQKWIEQTTLGEKHAKLYRCLLE